MSQVVLITGCSKGIGRNLAQRLAQSGYTTVATARKVETLDDLSATLRLPLDVTQPTSVTAAVEHTIERLGRLDVLVNNAGYAVLGAIEETSDEQAQAVFDTGVHGVLRMIRAVAPHMRRQKAGRIINVSSLEGIRSVPAMGVYAASKFAVEGLSDALRFELAPFGIQVVVIEPGIIKAESTGTDNAYSPASLSSANSPYRNLYRRLDQYYTAMQRNQPGPEAVARIIQQAIESPKPKSRYIVAVPFAGRLALRLGNAIWERGLRRIFQFVPSEGA